MPNEPDYNCDSEFLKLLTRRGDIDLTTVSLELARDAYPDLDFRPTWDWIEARAAELAGPVARAPSEDGALRELAECLAEQHGIYGNQEAYDRAESSYLHRVIETGRGIPISLSVLYMAVAQKVGIDLQGVCAPLHFLTRSESVRGPLFLDAFSHGRLLTPRECRDWLCRISRLPRRTVNSSLQAAGPRSIVIRMLNNLKAIYARQENWQAAWSVQHRLTALQPTSYEDRRDLAVISLHADQPGQAVDLLATCLRNCPCDERDMLEHHLQKAKGRLARWN